MGWDVRGEQGVKETEHYPEARLPLKESEPTERIRIALGMCALLGKI